MHLWDRLKRYKSWLSFPTGLRGVWIAKGLQKNLTVANRLSFELLFVEIWSLKKSSKQVGVICYWCESAACCTSHLTFKNTVLLAKPPNGWLFSRVLHHLLSTRSISCFFFPCWWIAVESFHWQNVASKSSLAKIETFFSSIPVVLWCFMWILIFCRLYLRPKTMQHFLAETM